MNWPRWAIGLTLLWTFACVRMTKRIPWYVMAVVYYTGLSTLYVTNWRYNPYYDFSKWNPVQTNVIQNFSAQGFIATLLVVLFVYFVTTKEIHRVLLTLFLIGFVHAVVFIAQKVVGFAIWTHRGDSLWGLFGNTSMGATYLAILTPMVLSVCAKGLKYFLMCLWVVALWYSQSSLAFGIFALSIGVYLLNCNCTIRGILKVVFTGAIALAIGPFFDYQFYTALHIDRWDIWASYLKWLDIYSNWWIGVGSNAFMAFGPSIQQWAKIEGDGHIMWLHNDWLQLLFENGIVGLILWINLSVIVLVKSFMDRNNVIFTALVAYLFAMLGNYPAQLFMFSLLGVGITYCAIVNYRFRI